MPRWLLGGIFGMVAAALDVAGILRKELSTRDLVLLIAFRISIGVVIGSPPLYRIPRHLRWVRGLVTSASLSIPLAILIPAHWQHMVGFGIAYGIIIGYLLDRILPLPSEIRDN